MHGQIDTWQQCNGEVPFWRRRKLVSNRLKQPPHPRTTRTTGASDLDLLPARAMRGKR